MKSLTRIVLCSLPLLLVVGCASTEVTERHTQMRDGERLARPDRIYVYPFAVTHADIPSWSTAAERFAKPSKAPTFEELEAGRKLGALVTKELIAEIQDMGMVVLEGKPHSLPKPNDIMLAGYLGAIGEGSRLKRLTLGFGAGAAELTTFAEAYQMTKKGPRLLGSATLDSEGNSTPGMIVPIAVTAVTANPIGLVVMGTVKVAGEVTGRTTIEGEAKRTAEELAELLEGKFKEQGWIK